MTKKGRWSDLSSRQPAVVAGAGAVQVGLLVAALADLRRRPGDQVKGPKALWAAISLVNWVGPLAYFTLGRRT